MSLTDDRFRVDCAPGYRQAAARSASSVLREHHTSAEVVPSLDGGYLIALDRADLDAPIRHVEATR